MVFMATPAHRPETFGEACVSDAKTQVARIIAITVLAGSVSVSGGRLSSDSFVTWASGQAVSHLTGWTHSGTTRRPTVDGRPDWSNATTGESRRQHERYNHNKPNQSQLVGSMQLKDLKARLQRLSSRVVIAPTRAASAQLGRNRGHGHRTRTRGFNGDLVLNSGRPTERSNHTKSTNEGLVYPQLEPCACFCRLL